jgi:hypothetical protein
MSAWRRHGKSRRSDAVFKLSPYGQGRPRGRGNGRESGAIDGIEPGALTAQRLDG